MSSSARLFVYLPAAPEDHEGLLRRLLAPLVRALAAAAEAEAVWFTRSSTPRWLLRLGIRGAANWLDAAARPLLAEGLAACSGAAIVGESELPEYRLELERWGGGAGAALAERMFFHDTLACLDRFELEDRGAAGRSRREYTVLMTDRLVDLLEFDRQERLDFYRLGHAWPLEQGVWSVDDLKLLEQKYSALKPGLARLLNPALRRDPTAAWGGREAAESAERCLAALQPLVREWLALRGARQLPDDFLQLVWSLAHMHALRLGIETTAEAVLRFFVFRLLEDGSASADGGSA